MEHNIPFYNLIEYVGGLDNELRMVRPRSDVPYILSLLGVIFGVKMMSESIVKSISVVL